MQQAPATTDAANEASREAPATTDAARTETAAVVTQSSGTAGAEAVAAGAAKLGLW